MNECKIIPIYLKVEILLKSQNITIILKKCNNCNIY